AAILGIGLLSQSLFRRGGWGQRFWGLDDTTRSFLRRNLGAGCLAALLILVTRQLALAASLDGFPAGGGEALERLLILAFQGVVFVLALRMGRPGSPLMTRVLAHVRDADGILWRAWPFVHGGLLAALAGVMALNVLGYGYAARFIWLHGLETLSIILGSRLVLLFLLVYGAQRLVHALYGPGGRWHDPARQQAADRSVSAFRFISQLLLSAIALLLILELWGVSVWSTLDSQLGAQIMTRGFVALVTVGIVLAVLRGSNVLAEYILRPRLTEQGEARELGRKLRTLTPLVQTLLKAVVLFIAALVLLEQVNIRTGPLLAGLGLFGIAVGLASQSLIKDIINGLFILFEDSISVGDV
ncbi:MAG: mechanosensitive ion channel, partial [Candidatus Tectomicrobia bacterium]|nr:mechanosensitive ion channel [Candidatus Tectomicrobia bacterium]